ncbi:thiamine phosphate synthase [Paractinoplanes hotanensis]|uniref:Thiamine phosphate synthase n=1 Tax=Paractinoplanes hotanensis TaxID=2906497 RepID=A0ABT0Y1A9_9ACTN|nr:thiamine phosphate synthase [Actinoplanes hotanensis]MCM4079821.1 thiamine phosphate synthase [Actinoplanes hotanensis]
MVTPGGLVVLTDRRLAAGSVVEVVRAAVRGGASWVILRERDLPYESRLRLATELRDVVPAGRLIVAGPDPLGGDAVHLAERDPLPIGDVRLAGRSRHGRLSDEDYATLSPIWLTETKPGYGPALGPAAAARLAGDVPWLALGGIDSAARAAECAAVGAAGVAVLGAIMRSADPERTAAELTEAFTATAAAPPRVGSLSEHAEKRLELSTGMSERRAVTWS